MGPSATKNGLLNQKINKNYFDFQYIIGRGGFGKVWKVQLKKTKEYFALKEMSKVKIIDRRSERSIISERDLLSKLKHPFIVNMHFAFQDFENLYLVMDLLTGGDLRYHIAKHKHFNEEQTKFFIACIIIGLSYIHSQNIIHRDIKPENLVCDKEGYIRITDFGVAKRNMPDNSSETSGTPGYMAPEVLFTQNHSFPADYFAIGVIGFEFMFGIRPYLGRNRKEIKDVIVHQQVRITYDDLPDGWSNEAADFINSLLERKPNKRLGCRGIEEIKKHPWMKDINWDDLLHHKIESPFKPREGDNFDKKYCEANDKIGEETLERYQDYVQDEEYIELFNGYTIINYVPKKEYITKRKNYFLGKTNIPTVSSNQKSHHKASSLLPHKLSANTIEKKNKAFFPKDLLLNKSSSVKMLPKKPYNYQKKLQLNFINRNIELPFKNYKTINSKLSSPNSTNNTYHGAFTQRSKKTVSLGHSSPKRHELMYACNSTSKNLPMIKNSCIAKHKSYVNVFTLGKRTNKIDKDSMSMKNVFNINDIIDKKSPKLQLKINTRKISKKSI